MTNIIYLACVRLEKTSGGYDYDPAIDPKNPTDIKMLACDDLIALQNENMDALDALREIADVVIVPVPLDTYQTLEAELNGVMTQVDEKIEEAANSMAAAYKIMGIEVDINEIKSTMMVQAGNCNGTGKVLNENLEIVDRADDYVTYDSCSCDCESDDEDYEPDDEDDESDYSEED